MKAGFSFQVSALCLSLIKPLIGSFKFRLKDRVRCKESVYHLPPPLEILFLPFVVPIRWWAVYATRGEGVFEKRYDELCQILNIRQYAYLSLITRTLAPSLDELVQFGYLADWRIEKTSDGDDYKIAFYHGEKFHRDRQARLSKKRTITLEQREPGRDERRHASPSRKRKSVRQSIRLNR
jgi:hypothetical protein